MEKTEKIYTSAPLPFHGQKRRQVKEFAKIIAALKPALVVDLFGGSGLLAHTAKRAYPPARVVYNDYDGYGERLAHVNETNAQLCDIRKLLQEHTSGSRIAGKLREDVLQYLRRENERGYVDWITLSSSLFYSMRYANSYAEISKGSLYNRMRGVDYTVDGYLDGLEVTRVDYRQLCEQHRRAAGALFIVDPPYFSTDTRTYTSVECWTLKDYLNVLTVLLGLQFVYFTSDKSQVVELCEWLDANGGKVRNIFKGASATRVFSPTTGYTGYTDIMLYKEVDYQRLSQTYEKPPATAHPLATPSP
jgi:hypothetical protein